VTLFIVLSAAVRILCTESLCVEQNLYAQSLLKCFVKEFENLFGKEYLSYNVHGLLHISNDVMKFGPLDSFSGFKFENYLCTLKTLVKSPNQPLQQIHNRIVEQSAMCQTRSNSKEKTAMTEHFKGPLIYGFTSPQYRMVNIRNFILQNSEPNCYCITVQKNIVRVLNICYSISTKTLHVLGKEYRTKTSVFEEPCPSELLGIYETKDKSTEIQSWPLESFTNKCQVYKFKNKVFCFVMLHSG